MIQNRESEQTVLGIMLIDGTIVQESRLEREHFFNPQHGKIYETMLEVAKQGIEVDLQSATAELSKADELESVGGLGYLVELAQAIPTTANFTYHENLIFEAYRNRETRKQALQYAENPSDEALIELTKQLEVIQSTGIIEKTKSTYDHLMQIAESMMSPPTEAQTGYATDYQDLDRMTGGWQNGDLIIVAARPSVGKTAFALNIAKGHCLKDGTTHIYSLEMGAESLLKRMLSTQANIDGQKWRNFSFSSDDYNRAMRAVGIMSDWNLEIHEDENTINEIVSSIRRNVKNAPDEKHLVVIDYLQLIAPSGKHERRDLEVGAMTRALKLLAKDLNIPIILLSQLSRGVEQRQDKRPMMSDLRESGNIEQDADVIGFLYRDDYYDKGSEKQNIIEIILSKQRNGPTGTVELAFIKEYGKFLNLDHRYSN